MQQKRAPKPRTRAGAKIDYIQVGRVGLQDAALGKLFRPAVAQNPSMSMPVVGQLYFLERGRARSASCALQQRLTHRAEPMPATSSVVTCATDYPWAAGNGYQSIRRC